MSDLLVELYCRFDAFSTVSIDRFSRESLQTWVRNCAKKVALINATEETVPKQPTSGSFDRSDESAEWQVEKGNQDTTVRGLARKVPDLYFLPVVF
jgi:hypothetical protein